MILPKFASGKLLNKIITLILLQAFILSSVAFGSVPQDTPQKDISKQEDVIVDPDKIIVQRDFGLIKSRFTGKNKKLIVHIQDAHCNFEAQSNIIKILEGLIKNDGLALISVEGADGFIDTTWFKAFPDEEIRKEVATYFMKKGEITGPEFLSITTDYPIKLFGAETRSYYIENLNAFTAGYPLKDDTEKYYNQIKTVLNRLKNYIYSEELKTLDAKIQDYEAKKIQFTDYVKYLESEAGKHQIKLREYQNLFKLVGVLICERKINFDLVDKERTQVIDALTKKLAKDALTELVNQSLSFKVGKISSAEYYEYLKATASKYGITLIDEYPNLFNYIIYNSVYSKIENEKLFKDIKDVERAIKEKLFANDEQRTLDKLSYHTEILLGLVNIKLLNGDFDYYKARKDEFSHEVFASFINKMSARYGFAYEMEPPYEAVKESMPKLVDFYEIAIKRDKALVNNTLQAMNKEGVPISVLVTGGFHSEGITKLLENQDISYIVVCPNITKEVETPYIKILTNQRTPLEEILSDTGATTVDAKNVKGSMLAPPLLTYLLNRPIRGLTQERTESDLREWADLNIAKWLDRVRTKATAHKISLTARIAADLFMRDVDASIEKLIAARVKLGRPLSKMGKKTLRKNAEAVKALAPAIIGSLLNPRLPSQDGNLSPRQGGAIVKQGARYTGNDYTAAGYDPDKDYGLDERQRVCEAAKKIFTNIIPRERLKTAKILDCATGRGLLAGFAAKYGAAEVVALDASSQMLTAARQAFSGVRTNTKVRFVQSDMFDISDSLVNPDGSLEQFDYITVGNTLCFYDEKARAEFMLVARRHLKPGGKLIILEGTRYIDANGGVDHHNTGIRDDYKAATSTYLRSFQSAGYMNTEVKKINNEYDEDFGVELGELQVLMNTNVIITAEKKPWLNPAEVSPDKRIVMLISGGEAPGVNAYFAMMAKKLAPLGYSVEVVRSGINGLVVDSKEDFLKTRLIWIDEAKAEEILRKPGAFAGTARAKVYDDKAPQNSVNALNNLEGYCGTVIKIGGNDHMAQGGKLARAFKEAGMDNVLVLGFSKSIDYDAPGIYMMGADTAGRYARDLVRRAKAAPGSKKCVIVQAMGRDSGYLTAMAGDVNDPSVVIALPEWSYNEKTKSLSVSVNDIVKAVRDRMVKYGAATLIISEGFRVPHATLEAIAADHSILKRKLDTLEKDEHGNLKLAELEIGEFIRDVLAKELKEIGITDDNILFENPGYSYRDLPPNELDLAVAEAVTDKAVEAILNKRKELIHKGGAKITVPRGVKTAAEVKAEISELPTMRDTVDLCDFKIFTRKQLASMGVLGLMDINRTLPDIEGTGDFTREDGVDIDAAATAIMSQSESATALSRFNVCVIARDDADSVIDALRSESRERSPDERWVDARTNDAKIYIKSTDNIDLAGILEKVEAVRKKYRAGNLIISMNFSFRPSDPMILKMENANSVLASIIDSAETDANGNLVFGRKLADLLILALKWKKKISGVRKNVLGESLNRLPRRDAARASSSVGAIRGEGGEVSAGDHGARTYGATESTSRSSFLATLNDIIRDRILKMQAYTLIPYNNTFPHSDESIKLVTEGGLKALATGAIARDNLNNLRSSEFLREINLVVIKGLKEKLIEYGVVPDLYFHYGVTRNAVYIDEDDFLYLLSLHNGVDIIMKALKHEKAHIDNPRLPEDVIETLAPSYSVRLAFLTRGMSGRNMSEIDRIYREIYERIVGDGKEYTPEAIASEYKISADIASVLLDKVSEESGYNILKREMYQSVIANTPDAIKNNPLIDASQKGRITIKFTRENLGDFDPVNNPNGMNLKSWLAKYKKEASASTAGIRGVQNILFPNDPRELIGQKAIILATVAKALVALSLYPGAIHKFASSEVRFNSREYVEFIARIQAALGIKTHIPLDGATTPIWMASFLIFKYDLMGSEYVTSSHAISKKTATKDLNSEGSQYIPDESKLFVDEIEKIIKEIEDKGEFAITLAAVDDENIDHDFMKKVNNGIDDYVRYLKSGIATPSNIELIKKGKNRIFIDVVGGCMYRTMSRIFEKLGISDKFDWLHVKEDPYFHGIGKSCYRFNTENGKMGLEDLSCDTSIVVINSKEDVEKIGGAVEKFKDKISEKAALSQVLIPVPGSNSKVFGQIRVIGDIDLRLLRSKELVDLGGGKVLVFETGIRILPVIRTMGYKQSLKDAPVGTVIELTDPDGDRLITAQIVDIDNRDRLEKLGLAYEILDSKRVLVVFMPNQSFLMTIDFRKQMLKQDGEWAKRNWFMIKTTASAAAWDDWAAAQDDKSYKIKYAGTDKWVEAKGVPVINTPVGFKEIASIMKKAEKQMREAPDKDVIIEDIFGNQINIGVQPRLLFAGEESGGEIFGPTEMIESTNGRRALAMREKSAGEAMVITSAMAADLEAKDVTLVDYLVDIFDKNNIVNRFDYREDVIYFNESEPDINIRKRAEAEGLKMKEENDFFFLAIAVALRDGKITFGQASTFLKNMFPAVDFTELKGIYFVGDGVYLKFADRVVEIRPSGTEAKTKGYAMGASPRMLVNDAKALAGYYSKDMRDQLMALLGQETHAAYFKEAEFMGTKMPAVKVRALEIYSAYLANGAETKQFTPPEDYQYLSVPVAQRLERQDAAAVSRKLHTPLVAAAPEMATRFTQGGYNQSGYGVRAGAAIDGSFAINDEGNQGYCVNGGKEVFLSTVKNMKDFFRRRAAILDRNIRYVIKPGIGGQHTPFQAIAGVFQVIDAESGMIVGEYELGKDYESAISDALEQLGVEWDEIAVIPSSKSGSTDETMMIFSEIFYILLKNVATKLYHGLDGEAFAKNVFDTLHEVNFIDGKERPAKDLFKVDKERFGTDSLIELITKRAADIDIYAGPDITRAIMARVLGNMFFETTDNPSQSRLAAFIKNSGLDKELGENAPGFGAMFDNVGGRWTADLHMMTFLAYHKLDAEKYWSARYEGIKSVREGTHKANELAGRILDEGITDIALIIPNELFWFGKAMEQNFNESIWQNGFANLVAITEENWRYQEEHYTGKPSRLVINLSSSNIPESRFNLVNLGPVNLSALSSKQEMAGKMGELFTTFYGMTNTVGNRLIARALAEKGYTPADVDLNDLDNPATKIVQQNLYVRQPYVELGKGLLEGKLKGLQAEGPNAIEEELRRIKEAAKRMLIQSNVGEFNSYGSVSNAEEIGNVILHAIEFAKNTNRKFVPFIYLEGEKFRELREHLVKLGIEWVMQGTGDQHISYQQVLAQPQKYLPFIISFVPEQTLPGRPAIGFAKGYLHNVSPNMVRDLFAEASYKALTERRNNEAGQNVEGAAGIFMRISDTGKNREMLSQSFDKAMTSRGSDKKGEPPQAPEAALEDEPAAASVPSAAGIVDDNIAAMVEARYPGLRNDEHYKKYVRAQMINFVSTISLIGLNEDLKSDITVLLAHDTNASEEQREAVLLCHQVLQKYLGASLIVVRATGDKLIQDIDDKVEGLRRSGKKFAVVALTGNETFKSSVGKGLITRVKGVNAYMRETFNSEDPDGLPISAVLNVQKSMPVMVQYDIALRLAYNQGRESILRALAVALDENKHPFTRDELEDYLRRGWLCLRPVERIDIDKNIDEVSRAESAALRAL